MTFEVGSGPKARENDSSDLLDYDDMLERIGQLGKWHVRSVLLLWIPTVIVGIAFMKYSFALGTPSDFRCHVTHCDSENGTNSLRPDWAANFIPPRQCEGKVSSPSTCDISMMCLVS